MTNLDKKQFFIDKRFEEQIVLRKDEELTFEKFHAEAIELLKQND